MMFVLQIYRDMWRRQQYTDVNILDGRKWGYLQYLIEGRVCKLETSRIILPISVDDNIDLKQ